MDTRDYSYKILQDIDLSENELRRVSKIDTSKLTVSAGESLALNSPKIDVDSTNIGVTSSSILANTKEETLVIANSYVNTSTNVKFSNDSMTVDAKSISVGSESSDLSIKGEGVSITSGKDEAGSVVHSDIVEFDTLRTFSGDKNLNIKFDNVTNSLIFSAI